MATQDSSAGKRSPPTAWNSVALPQIHCDAADAEGTFSDALDLERQQVWRVESAEQLQGGIEPVALVASSGLPFSGRGAGLNARRARRLSSAASRWAISSTSGMNSPSLSRLS
jgi:hypothetical protein